MNEIVQEQIRELMPAFLGHPEGLPEIDSDEQLAFMDEFFDAGGTRFRALYYLCLVSLKLFSLLVKWRSFSKLSDFEKQDLLQKLFNRRNPLVRGVSVLLGMPIYISYYRREEVQVELGFNARSLKEEADLRTVSRDRSLPPK